MAEKSSLRKRSQGNSTKKENTIKRRQDSKKKRLLEILEESANLGQALSRIDTHRTTYWRWRQEDQVFAMDADSALWNGIEKMADMVETSLLSQARNGDMRAIKLYLENNHTRYKKYGLFNIPSTDGSLSLERQKEIATALRNWNNKKSNGAQPTTPL